MTENTHLGIPEFRRKISSELLAWKQSEARKPLIIKGPRQCGKTFIVKKFAAEHYPNVIYLNFFENPAYKNIFEESLEVDHLIMMISALKGNSAKFTPGQTLIILDEIQECPQARTALKFFHTDGRYDVIATGSLLGVKGYISATASIPVGSESIIEMHPLDFEEFLWANDISAEVISTVKQHFENETAVPQVLHQRFRELFLQYAVVGGMPEVVKKFVTTNQINLVLQLQRDLLASYEDDMVKHADAADKSAIRECFRSIPAQLAKENKKFQYSVIRKGARASKYEGALQWIEDAGIINRCYNLNITELPLAGNADLSIFKIYMSDCGLFTALLETGTQADILQGNLFGYKGAIFENLIADVFTKLGHQLYYFRKDSGLEIDFIIRWQNLCVPVEIKATDGNAKSLKTIFRHPEKYHVEQAIKLGDYNVGRNENILTLPAYMAMFLMP